jgi:hypothetical protein
LPVDWIGKIKSAMFQHCMTAGWKGTHLANIGPVLVRDNHALYYDSVGIILYQLIYGRWVRIQGLAYANMRSLLKEPTMTFIDGAQFTIN